MTVRRLLLITRGELAFNARRPLFYVLLAIVALLIWGVSAGHVTIVSSGDSTVGGHKAFLTSEFAVARLYIAIAAILHAFFFAIAGGMSIIRDDEAKVGEILHATPLTPGEYVWGKFMGALVTIVAMLAVQTVITLVLYHGLPNGDMIETRGPFALANYLRPTLFLVLPYALFVTGGSFAIGAWTRKPVLVFFLPIAFTLIEAFFLWNWSPSWLPLSVNRMLQWVDPSGMRWLQEMWLKTDRGTAFYNVQPIGYDPAFLMSRLVLIAIGFGAVALVARHFAATIRSSGKVTTPAKTTTAVVAPAPLATPEPIVGGVSLGATLAALKMRSRTPSFFAATLAVARAEARELRSQPGLYLFVPIILMQVIGTALVSLGTFDTPLLLTPGTLAENSMGQLIGYMALLLLFYTVESLERERATRFAAIHSSLPVPTGAMLAGKAIALGIVGAIVTVAALLGCLVAVMVQGKVGFSFTPFILLWGVLLVPSFIAWTTFVMATYSVTKNRYTSYAVGVGVFALSVYLLLSGKLNWLDNWSLWNVVKWSDISVLEVDRTALVLSRLFYLAVAVMLARVATRHFPRRERDAVNTIHRLRFSSLWRSGMRALPTLLLPLVTGAFLWKQIDHGPNGAAAKKTVKDYWKKNLSTWKDARAPAIGDVNMDVAIEPAERRWRVKGTYLIVNKSDTVVHWLPVSVGLGWHDLAWTIDGVKTTPDTASHLNVFKLATPLAAGDSLRLGFSYVGQQTGALKNGGAGMTFVVPSGVVMTNFDPRWFPFVGYVESIGQDDDNKYEPKEYADDFWKGITPPGFGSSLPMTVTTRITVPKDFEANGVGERMSDDVHGDTRTVVWHTDHPVMAFNIVAGRWKVRRGTGTALYYDPKHEYNAAEIADALDQARKYYGQWFGEFPWRELKISEFPALATYAQGFPTNITFSESIGFLTKSEPKTYLAFLVTAHEIAHQWWGNMLLPGEGPSGNLLSEGMAHFSTTLLIEQVKGFRGALEFRKRIESRYNDNRRVDAERKLYRLDGSKDGDQTVLYDKGGWVFWMLARRMGRENALHGMRDFIAKYTNNPDHAVLHDFTEHMRTYAPDTASYDDFIKQWMDTVVVPEYRVTDAKTVKQGSDWVTTATVENIGTGRMPMEAAATIGDRFPDDDATAAKKAKATAYQDSRIPLTLGAKEKQQITIRSTFEPDKVIVDPDVTVLQLRRKLAESSVSK